MLYLGTFSFFVDLDKLSKPNHLIVEKNIGSIIALYNVMKYLCFLLLIRFAFFWPGTCYKFSIKPSSRCFRCLCSECLASLSSYIGDCQGESLVVMESKDWVLIKLHF